MVVMMVKEKKKRSRSQLNLRCYLIGDDGRWAIVCVESFLSDEKKNI